MRKEINVLWLDDNSGEDVDTIKDSFKDALEEYGYRIIIHSVTNFEEAFGELADSSKRIDFFVTDFNLEADKTGIDFLFEIRRLGKKKEHLILYSNSRKEEIRKAIKGVIDSDLSNIDYLVNYSFFSTNNFTKPSLKRNFEESIDEALVRWNELSSLRSEYASLNSLLEWVVRNILNILNPRSRFLTRTDKTYHEYINIFEGKIKNHCLLCTLSPSDIDKTFKEWSNCKTTRNALEHNVEKWDIGHTDFLIEMPNHSIQLFEKDVISHRKKLISQVQIIKRLLDDVIHNNPVISGILSIEEYINLSKGLL